MLKNHYIFITLVGLSLWIQPIFSWEWPQLVSRWTKNPTPPSDPTPVTSEPSPKVEDPTPVTLVNSTPSVTDQKSQTPQNQISRCELLGSQAITDWLNSINIGSFFDYGGQHIRNHNDCFVFFNSINDLSVWIDSYGFNSHYRSPLARHQKMDLYLTSLGAGIGGQFIVSDEVKLGGGVGYFHSDFESKNDFQHSEINGVYFGPAVQYLFSEGWVGLTVFGMGNFYDGKRKVCLPNNESSFINYNANSWDIDVRVETEYNLEPPSDFFIPDLTFHPFLRMDYLNVFELSHRDKVNDTLSLISEGRSSSYFYSKLGMRFEKVMICNQSGIFTFNLGLGWINMSPLSSDAVKWKGAEESRSFDSKPESKNQLALDAGFMGMYTNGFLIGLDYAGAFGANSPIQTARMRLEWNW